MNTAPLHGAEMMLFLVSVLSHQLHDKAEAFLIHVYNTFEACLGGEVLTMAIHNMQIFSKSDFKIMHVHSYQIILNVIPYVTKYTKSPTSISIYCTVYK